MWGYAVRRLDWIPEMTSSEMLANVVRYLQRLGLCPREIERVIHNEAVEGDYILQSAVEVDNMTRYLQSIGISDGSIESIKRGFGEPASAQQDLVDLGLTSFGPYIDNESTTPCPPPEVA